MSNQTSFSKSDNTFHRVFLTVLFGSFLFLILRAWDMYPSVFPDEYVHSKAARLIQLESAQIPGYLFYWVYSLTGLFEEHFFKVARIFNAAFFAAGSYLIFLIARRFAGAFIAMIIGTVSVLSPMNSYTTYFMPESMFFFVFWVLMFVILQPKRNDANNTTTWVTAGVVFGALSLVKPHALFIYPAIPIFAIIVYRLNKSTVLNLFLFTVFAALIKFGLGYIAAGLSGLSFFGSMYTDHARSVISEPELILDAARSVSINLLGNFFLVTSILGLGFVHLFSVNEDPSVNMDERRIRILVSSLFLMLIPMVALFSTSVALYDLNLDNRLYLRYYNYVFPLVYIMMGVRLSNLLDEKLVIGRALLGGTFIIFTLVLPYYYTLNKFFYPFKLFMTDSPEFYLLQFNPVLLFTTCLLGIIVIVCWMYRESVGIRTYLYLFLPVYIIGVVLNGFEAMNKRYDPLPQDLIGIEYRSSIPKEEHDQITIAGQNRLILSHIASYSYSGETNMLIIDNIAKFDLDSLQLDTKWLIMSDSAFVPNHYLPMWNNEGMTIYKRTTLE